MGEGGPYREQPASRVALRQARHHVRIPQTSDTTLPVLHAARTSGSQGVHVTGSMPFDFEVLDRHGLGPDRVRARERGEVGLKFWVEPLGGVACIDWQAGRHSVSNCLKWVESRGFSRFFSSIYIVGNRMQRGTLVPDAVLRLRLRVERHNSPPIPQI